MKTKITWTWKKIVGIIAGFLGIGTLVSCYGMPFDYDSMYVGGTVKSADDETPIQGITVSAYSDYDYDKTFTVTDENGYYEVLVQYTYSGSENPGCELYFEDEDGEENGGYFFSKGLHLEKEMDKSFENNIKLEKLIPITVGGTVTAEDATPIKNIVVKSDIDRTFTDENGYYEIRTGAKKGEKATISFIDDDEYRNGGLFDQDMLEISLDKDNTTDNDIVLKKVEEDPDE